MDGGHRYCPGQYLCVLPVVSIKPHAEGVVCVVRVFGFTQPTVVSALPRRRDWSALEPAALGAQIDAVADWRAPQRLVVHQRDADRVRDAAVARRIDQPEGRACVGRSAVALAPLHRGDLCAPCVLVVGSCSMQNKTLQ